MWLPVCIDMKAAELNGSLNIGNEESIEEDVRAWIVTLPPRLQEHVDGRHIELKKRRDEGTCFGVTLHGMGGGSGRYLPEIARRLHRIAADSMDYDDIRIKPETHPTVKRNNRMFGYVKEHSGVGCFWGQVTFEWHATIAVISQAGGEGRFGDDSDFRQQ